MTLVTCIIGQVPLELVSSLWAGRQAASGFEVLFTLLGISALASFFCCQTPWKWLFTTNTNLPTPPTHYNVGSEEAGGEQLGCGKGVERTCG